MLRLLEQDLSAGEAEVIVLGVEGLAGEVLLDETDARQIADTFGLRKTGIIGLLIRARLEGKLVSLRDALDCLRKDKGWVYSA